jgi:hypothetical protein
VRLAKGEARAEAKEYFRDKYERRKAFLRQAIDRMGAGSGQVGHPGEHA